MKKDSKSEAMIASEKAEQQELITRILQCTNKVPQKNNERRKLSSCCAI